MPSFLPSEIGRLIYGYLLTECNENLAEEFLNSCDSLKECRMQKQQGRKFHATVQDLSLTGILNQYSVLSSIIFENSIEGDRVHRNLLNLLQNLLRSRLGAVVSYFENQSTCKNTSVTSVVPEVTPRIPPVVRRTTEVGVQCTDTVASLHEKRLDPGSCDAGVQCVDITINSLGKRFDSGFCDASTLTDITDISHEESTLTLPPISNSLLFLNNSLPVNNSNLLKSPYHSPRQAQKQTDAENLPQLNDNSRTGDHIPHLNNDPQTCDHVPQLNNDPRTDDHVPQLNNDPRTDDHVPQLNNNPHSGDHVSPINNDPRTDDHILQSNNDPEIGDQNLQLNNDPRIAVNIPQVNVQQTSSDNSQLIMNSCSSNSIGPDARSTIIEEVAAHSNDVNTRVPEYDPNLLSKPQDLTPIKIRVPHTSSENFVVTPSDKNRLVFNLRRTPLKVVEPNAASAEKKVANREVQKISIPDTYQFIPSPYRTPTKIRPKPPAGAEPLITRTPDTGSKLQPQRSVEKLRSDIPWDFKLRQQLADNTLNSADTLKTDVRCKKNRTPGKKRKIDEASDEKTVQKKSKTEEPAAMPSEEDTKPTKNEIVYRTKDSCKRRTDHTKNGALANGTKASETCKKRMSKNNPKPEDTKTVESKHERHERKKREQKSRSEITKVRDVEDNTSQKSIDATIDKVIRGEIDSAVNAVPAVDKADAGALHKEHHENVNSSKQDTTANGVHKPTSSKCTKHEVKLSEHEKKRKRTPSESVKEIPKLPRESSKPTNISRPTSSELQGESLANSVCDTGNTSVAPASNETTKNDGAAEDLKVVTFDEDENWPPRLVISAEFVLFHKYSRSSL